MRYLRQFCLISLLLVILSPLSAGLNASGNMPVENYNYHLNAYYRTVHMSYYDSTLYYVNQLMKFSPGIDSLAVNVLRKSNTYRLLNKKKKALAELIVFDSLAEHVATPQLLTASRLLHEARVLSDFEEAFRAEILYDNAIDMIIQLEGPRHSALPRYLAARGLNYHRLGELEKALNDYMLAESICLDNNMLNIDLANVLQNIGIIKTVSGDFELAMRFFKRSEEVRETLFGPESSEMASYYSNYGRFLSVIGDFRESLHYYYLSEKIILNQDPVDGFVLGHLLINIGNIMQIQGDLDKAKLYFQNAISLLEDRLSASHPTMVFAKNNLGYVYSATGELLKAKILYLQSLKVTEDYDSKQFILINLANLHTSLGNNDSAYYYHRLAKQFSLQAFGKNHYRTAFANLELGNYFLDQNMPDSAMKYFTHASGIYRMAFGEVHMEKGYVLLGIAQAYHQMGDYASSEKYFSKAGYIFEPEVQGFLASDRRGTFFADVRLVNYLAGRASLYLSWFKNEQDEVKLHKSLEVLKMGIDLVDLIGLAITDESRMLLNQNVRSMLADAMEVCYLLYSHTGDSEYLNEAFTYAGRSKAAVLLSSVRKLNALRAGGVPEAITETERKLNEGIASTRKLIFDGQQAPEPNHNMISYLESRHFKLVREYDSLLKYIERNYADYYTLRYDNRVVGIDEVKFGLQNDQVVLEYVLGSDNMYTFIIGKDGVDFIKSGSAEEIVHGVEAIRKQSRLDFSAHTMLEYMEFMDASVNLYEKLIGPSESRLSGKRLLIIPDGILGYLPFEILLPDAPRDPERIDYNGLPYLLRTNPISYAYSASLYFSGPSAHQFSSRKLIAFAPDYSTTALTQLSSSTRNEIDLSPLPFAFSEVNQVKQSMGGRVLKSAEASKANFIRLAPNYDILHLAMHAQINDLNPMYSTLIFQPDSDSIASFALSTYELYGMQLNAQLVVLSACNTGTGTLRQGEGVMSLTRGFVFAGVPSIVMTAWEVHDESGSLLMGFFYEFLSQGYPKDLALQQAKLKFLDQATQLKSHPYFWSAYVLVGDSTPLPPAKPGMPWFVYFLAAVLLIALVVLPRKSRRI